MANFRLSERARFELLAIYADSEGRFGTYQAEAYLAGLERIFGLLADFPRIDRSRPLGELSETREMVRANLQPHVPCGLLTNHCPFVLDETHKMSHSFGR